MQSNIAEFVGCLFLTLALGLTGDPLASGLVIIGIITVGRLFSHAHFNPAVTLAFWSAGRLSSRRLRSEERRAGDECRAGWVARRSTEVRSGSQRSRPR